MALERAMELVLERQARTEKDMDELRSLVTEIAREQLDLSQIVKTLAEGQVAAQVDQGDLRSSIEGLRSRVAEIHESLAAEIKALTDAQRITDERLNALIDIVDGIIRRPPPTQ